MLADQINSILTMDRKPSTILDDISDVLNLITLLSNKISLVIYHKRHLAKRILGDCRRFDVELERFVVSGLIRRGYTPDLLRPISRLLDDCILFEIKEEKGGVYKVVGSSNHIFLIGERGREGGGGGGGGGGDGVLLKGSPFEFDIRYLSKSAWQQCEVW
jgi:hypothetical protein